MRSILGLHWQRVGERGRRKGLSMQSGDIDALCMHNQDGYDSLLGIFLARRNREVGIFWRCEVLETIKILE